MTKQVFLSVVALAMCLILKGADTPLPLQGDTTNLPLVGFKIQLDTISTGFDKTDCWVHPRAGAIPGEMPSVVLTMQKLLLTGSDIFYALNEMRTDDLGQSWSGPQEHTATWVPT